MTSRLTRPRRTKMYDCNYRMGERNYRPVLDDLDRKYSGRGGGSGEGGLSTLRGALAEAEAALPTRRDATPDLPEPRRRPLSSLLDDDDSFFDVASKKSAARRQAMLKLEDGFDDALEADSSSSSSRRVRDSRKRIAALEEELAGRRSGVDFADKVLDSVGLSGDDVSKARQYLQQRRKVTISSSSAASEDDDAGKSLLKWTKLGAADKELVDVGGGAAAARARKSRARLQDIENEMEELADRAAARERRSANVRALLQETADVGSASSVQAASSTTTVRVRKVAASAAATEKTVSF